MRTIVFIDNSLGGHKLAYMCYHVKTAAELGHIVLCIVPEAEKIQEWVNTNHPGLMDKIKYYAYSKQEVNIIEKSGPWSQLMSKLKLWWIYNSIIKKAEKIHNVKVDLVFFNWLDSLLTNYAHPVFVNTIFKYKWAGIYFHPQILRFHPEFLKVKASVSDIDIALTSKNCIAVGLHDEGIVEGQSYRIHHKKVLLFPEIADDTPANVHHKIFTEIKEKANGRTIVGILGVEPFKGSAEFMRIAKRMDSSKYFFALTGPYEEFYLDYFHDAATAAEFKEFITNPPENVYVNLGLLKEGEEYNSVFSAFDIVFIIYKRFPSASNRLTKASHLKRLVITDEKYCVGEDVRKYNLGIGVNGENIDEIEKGITQLRERILKNEFPLKEWEIYAAKNSIAVLKDRFAEIIGLL